MRSVWVGGLLFVLVLASHAEELFELKGRNYACKDASKMNLWDLARNSELIRYEMTQKGYCWRSPPGVKVRQLARSGSFVHAEYLSNGLDFFAYRSDLGPVSPVKEPAPPPKERIEVRSSVQLKSVNNTSEFGVLLMRGRPSVEVVVDAGGGLIVSFHIVKEKIASGFDVRISDQRNPYLTVGGRCKAAWLGLGSPDFFHVRVLGFDAEKQFVDFELSGQWNKCDVTKALTYELKPATLRISGSQFKQLVRPHTQKELSKVIDDK